MTFWYIFPEIKETHRFQSFNKHVPFKFPFISECAVHVHVWFNWWKCKRQKPGNMSTRVRLTVRKLWFWLKRTIPRLWHSINIRRHRSVLLNFIAAFEVCIMRVQQLCLIQNIINWLSCFGSCLQVAGFVFSLIPIILEMAFNRLNCVERQT